MQIVIDAGYLNFGFWILLVITGLHECEYETKLTLRKIVKVNNDCIGGLRDTSRCCK